MKWFYRVWLFFALALLFAPIPAGAAPPQSAPETYIVQSGDTLFAIAARYHTTVAAIKQLNKLGESDLIQVGQKLLIPTDDAPTTTTRHIVQADDTLYRIALQYGTTVRALARLNDLAHPNLIALGQALAIPSNADVIKPGLLIDPPAARQGGTILIQIARPEIATVTGTFNGKPITFTPGAGYFYALVGVSRCAKIGNAALSLTLTDTFGESATETATINIETTAFVVQSLRLPTGKGALLDNTLQTREAAQLAAIVGKTTPARLWSGAWRQPLYGPISSAFGTRRSYNGGPVGACGHEGTDFDVDANVPIYAPARGQVVFAGLTQVRGNMTVIDHGVGVFSAYYHQAAIDAQVGQIVEPGTLIGKVGTTGLSTGPHLHWSVFVHGEYVDPLEWTRRTIP
ncbi:MAG: LysM peptidoglycan-binding domain-containing protein [Anaerolineales bacterium]|nr:LysM peptidoglycan-binding domain-containing protein [Anaerolineales bacterium]